MLLDSRSIVVLYFLNFLFCLPVVLCHTLVDEPTTVAASRTSQSTSVAQTPTEAKPVPPKSAEICTDQKLRLRKEWYAEQLQFLKA